jgi:hypothetical protein
LENLGIVERTKNQTFLRNEDIGGGIKESSGGDEFKYNVFDTL